MSAARGDLTFASISPSEYLYGTCENRWRRDGLRVGAGDLWGILRHFAAPGDRLLGPARRRPGSGRRGRALAAGGGDRERPAAAGGRGTPRPARRCGGAVAHPES